MSRIPIDDDNDVQDQEQDDGSVLEGEGTDSPGTGAADFDKLRAERD
ncbi:MAG: hypothetical protein M3478_15320 [Planctomycetota bacterium]|nr:hypothetical protein [Planctomycetota bacterium]